MSNETKSPVLKCECGGIIHQLKKDNFPVALAMCIKCQKDHGIYSELLKRTLSSLTGVPAEDFVKGPKFAKSPGMRALEALDSARYIGVRWMSRIQAEECAAIIERETHCVELYEALETLLKMQPSPENDCERGAEITHMARAALSKARGDA